MRTYPNLEPDSAPGSHSRSCQRAQLERLADDLNRLIDPQERPLPVSGRQRQQVRMEHPN